MMVVGIDVVDELQEALKKRKAHMNARQYLELNIAQHFTEIDGSAQLYVGRERILSSSSAWPIPHDAPYKRDLDRYIMAITEAGLYEKWKNDMLSETKLESRARQRERLQQQQQGVEEPMKKHDDGSSSGSSVKAFTIIHLQGPFMLLLLGLVISGEMLIVEILIKKFSSPNTEM